MTDTIPSSATPKTKKAAAPKQAEAAAPADLLSATAKHMETSFEQGVKAMKQHFETYVVDTADFKIATEESAKLLDHTQSATVDGMTALSQEITDFIERSSKTASDTMKALLSAKSPVEAMEVENRYLMDAAGNYVSHLQRLHAISVETVTKAWEPLADYSGAPLFTWWKKAA